MLLEPKVSKDFKDQLVIKVIKELKVILEVHHFIINLTIQQLFQILVKVSYAL